MAMKGYSTFPPNPASLESHHQIVLRYIQDTQWGVLILCRGAVGVFYSPSRLGNKHYCCATKFPIAFPILTFYRIDLALLPWCSNWYWRIKALNSIHLYSSEKLNLCRIFLGVEGLMHRLDTSTILRTLTKRFMYNKCRPLRKARKFCLRFCFCFTVRRIRRKKERKNSSKWILYSTNFESRKEERNNQSEIRVLTPIIQGDQPPILHTYSAKMNNFRLTVNFINKTALLPDQPEREKSQVIG